MPDAQHRKAPTPRAKEIRDHRDLRVWRKSIKLREECQAIVEGFPPERASMARQIRDLSARVPSRIEQGNDQGYHAP